MKTFEHSKAWIESVTSIYGEPTIRLIECEHSKHCRKTYNNVDEACGGFRVQLEDGDAECPCRTDGEDISRLIPKLDVILMRGV